MYFFSVIIPVYNAEDYLKECVGSVLKHDFKDVEIILVDDFSTDKSGKICDDFADKNKNIRALHQPANLGVSASRNRGIQTAIGQYILFLDSDDYLLGECLGGLARLIEERHKPDMIIGKFIYRPEIGGGLSQDCAYDGAVINQGEPDDVIAHINSLADSLAGFSGACWRYVIRRNFILENNLYFIPVIIYEDQEFIAKLLCLAKTFAFYDDFFYCHRTRPKSLSCIMDYRADSSAIEVVGRLCEFIKNSDLSAIKKNFIYTRIKYSLSIFIAGMSIRNREEIFELSSIIEKHIDHIGILKEVANGFDLHFFIKKFGSSEGLVLYKEFVAEDTISLLGGAKEKEFYIFCVGRSGAAMARILLDNGYSVKGFLDNNQALENTNFSGLNVNNPLVLSSISDKELSNVYVAVCNQRGKIFEQILNQLQKVGLKKEQIVHKVF